MVTLDFNPQTEIPSLANKVILVTGGTAGLGYETVLSLASHQPGHIYFTGRSQPSADKLLNAAKEKFPDVPITFLRADLASLASVQEAVKSFLEKSDRLDLLMANAGIMAVPPGLTKDGYEIQFGTNHVGHALLAKLLTPILERTQQTTGDVRIVWTSSTAYNIAPKTGLRLDTIRTTQENIFPVTPTWVRYGQSKLANLLYARAFAKHHPNITSVSIHPGVSATGLVTSMNFAFKALVYVTNIGKMLSPEQCAWNQQWAATAPLGSGKKRVESGKYYEPIGVAVPLKLKVPDDALAEELWEWTEKELASYSL